MKLIALILIGIALILIAHVGLNESGMPPKPRRQRWLGGDWFTDDEWKCRGYQEPISPQELEERQLRIHLEDLRRANLSWGDIEKGKLIEDNIYPEDYE